MSVKPFRIRLPLAAALLLAAWTPAFSAPASSPANAAPSFGEVVDVNVVNVEVYVTDRKRQSGDRSQARGISTLLEDGKSVSVSNFTELARGASTAAAEPAVPRVPAASPGAAKAEAPAPPAADPDRQLSLVVFVDNLHLRPENRTRAVEQIRQVPGPEHPAGATASWSPPMTTTCGVRRSFHRRSLHSRRVAAPDRRPCPPTASKEEDGAADRLPGDASILDSLVD